MTQIVAVKRIGQIGPSFGKGQELLLVYLDSGGDTVSASWAAADNRLDGEV